MTAKIPKHIMQLVERVRDAENWATPTWKVASNICYSLCDSSPDDTVLDFIGLLIDELERTRDVLANPCNFAAPCGECEACSNTRKVLEGGCNAE